MPARRRRSTARPTWVVQTARCSGRAGAGGVVDKHGNKGRSFEGALRVGDRAGATPRAYDPVARLELMDEIGHLGADHLPGRRRPRRPAPRRASCRTRRCATLCLEIFNDANAELQAESGDRLLPMAILPAWDIDACVREAQRARRARPARRQPHVGPAGPRVRPTSRAAPWDPLWEACADAGAAGALPHRCQPHHDELLRHLPVGLPRRRHQARDRRHAAVHRQRARRRQHHLLGDARPAIPELKIVSVESGAGWVPFILEALDYEMDENAPQDRRRDVAARRRSTSSRQIYATTWFEHTQPRRSWSPRSARTTSCSRPTSRTPRACTPTR